MAQVISKGGKVFCVTLIPYDSYDIRSMKKAGYKLKEIPSEEVKPLPMVKSDGYLEGEKNNE